MFTRINFFPSGIKNGKHFDLQLKVGLPVMTVLGIKSEQ